MVKYGYNRLTSEDPSSKHSMSGEPYARYNPSFFERMKQLFCFSHSFVKSGTVQGYTWLLVQYNCTKCDKLKQVTLS